MLVPVLCPFLTYLHAFCSLLLAALFCVYAVYLYIVALALKTIKAMIRNDCTKCNDNIKLISGVCSS